MILVLCPSRDAVIAAAQVKANEIAYDGPTKWSSGGYGVESLTMGGRWHFVSTDSLENARYLQGQVYTSFEGEIPNEFWREQVLPRIRD